MDEISAGAGIGYFGMIWNIGQGGLNRGIVGGPSTLTEAVSVALGDRVELGAEVQEIVNESDSVVVRYRQDGIDREVEARCVVLATPATVSHRVAVDLPTDVRDALGKVVYGPHVSAGVPHRRDERRGPGTTATPSPAPSARSPSRSTRRASSAAPSPIVSPAAAS